MLEMAKGIMKCLGLGNARPDGSWSGSAGSYAGLHCHRYVGLLNYDTVLRPSPARF